MLNLSFFLLHYNINVRYIQFDKIIIFIFIEQPEVDLSTFQHISDFSLHFRLRKYCAITYVIIDCTIPITILKHQIEYYCILFYLVFDTLEGIDASLHNA